MADGSATGQWQGLHSLKALVKLCTPPSLATDWRNQEGFSLVQEIQPCFLCFLVGYKDILYLEICPLISDLVL